eukprot:4404067-Lingulodinium_polyedra.AAC.1
MRAVEVVVASVSSAVGWRSAKKVEVSGPPLKSGTGAALPASETESSMAVNSEPPWRFGHRARKCSSLWHMLH